MRVLDLLVKLVLVLSRIQASAGSLFSKVSDEISVLCTIDSPSDTQHVRSAIACALACEGQSDCVGFNILLATGNVCQMFYEEPVNYDAIQNCIYFKVYEII
jgi:hypothetical protein